MHKLNHTRAAVRLATVLFLLFLVMPPALEAQETQDTMKLAAPLRAARAAFSGGYMAFDASKVTPLFTADAVVVFQNDSFSGKEAVDAWVANSMQGLSAIRFGTASFTVSDAEVVDRNTYVVTLGDGTTAEGTSELVWRRQADGSWKVARLTAT